MGFINGLLSKFKLTTTERQDIYKRFGSFVANGLALVRGSFLKEGYKENIDVFSVIKKIVDSSLVVPWIVEKRTAEGWETVTDTSLNDVIESPNKVKGLTWADIIERALTYNLTTGNAYIFGETSILGKAILQLDVLPSPLTMPSPVNNSFLAPEVNYIMTWEGSKITFEATDIAHIKYFNPDFSNAQELQEGLSPIAVAARAVKVGNDRWDADANLLQNRGAIGMITDGSDEPVTEGERKKIQGHFDGITGGTKNFGRIIVTNKDLKFVQLAMSSADLQLIEKGVVTLRSICNVYGLDSSLFNDPANKTFNNRKEAEKALWANAVKPNLEKIQKYLQLWLLPTHLDPKQYRIRPDFSGIEALQEDFHEKVKSYSLMVQSSIITPNAAATALNQEESKDPNADKLLIRTSTALLESLTQEKEPDTPDLENIT